MSTIKAGDAAPDFTLPDQHGAFVSLREFKGKKTVVLYFYPKDDTMVCTREACGFKEDHARFLEAGAVVIGVSSDPVSSHQAFADRYGLPFYLLSDSEGKVRARYGATAFLGMPGRVTYVIDRTGIVRLVYSSMFSAKEHIEKALDTVRDLERGGEPPPTPGLSPSEAP